MIDPDVPYIIRKRQAEGIAKAKARGVYKGRRKQIDDQQIRELKAQGKRVSEIASELGVSRMSVYRALDATDDVPSSSAGLVVRKTGSRLAQITL